MTSCGNRLARAGRPLPARPRLAECFSGAPHPGTLTWTADVDSATGLVSDHHLEPTLASDDLTAAQRDCLLCVLSTPPDRLDATGSPATPARISMGIEF